MGISTVYRLVLSRSIDNDRKLVSITLFWPYRDQSRSTCFGMLNEYISIIAVEIMARIMDFSAADSHGIVGLVLRALASIFNLHFTSQAFSI